MESASHRAFITDDSLAAYRVKYQKYEVMKPADIHGWEYAWYLPMSNCFWSLRISETLNGTPVLSNASFELMGRYAVFHPLLK